MTGAEVRPTPYPELAGGRTVHLEEGTEGALSSRQEVDWWGDTIGTKSTEILRIGVLNINGFSSLKCNSRWGCKTCKDCLLRSYLKSHQFDIIGLSETNVLWKNVSPANRLHERMFGWWSGLHLSYAYFKNYASSQAFQPGGVALLSTGEVSHRVAESGSDTHGLGRWSWTRYRGRNGIFLRICSAYRPNINKNGPATVWSQQKSYFDGQNESECPLRLYDQHLLDVIQEWMTAGDQIVLLVDLNDDVRRSPMANQLKALGLKEVCTNKHGDQGPATRYPGSAPIDGIFVTPSLLNSKCGYLEPWSDHRCLYIDIPFQQVFGISEAATPKFNGRRLKCTDPRVVQRYLSDYATFVGKHNLHARTQELLTSVTEGSPLNLDQIEEWEAIDRLRVQGMLEAEKHCRKIRAGEVPWSPSFQILQDQIIFWTLLVKKRKGGRVHSRYLLYKAKRAQLVGALHSTLDEAIRNRLELLQQRRGFKQNALAERESWLLSVAQARAQAGNLSVAQEYENQVRIEHQRRNARIIRRTIGSTRGSGINEVVAPNAQGQWATVNDKLGMEQALLAENERRFRQASHTPFLVPPLFSQVGKVADSADAMEILQGTYDASNLDPATRKFITQLKIPDNVKMGSLSLHQSVEDYRRHWQRAREATSSGRSGLHFGHFIANSQHLQLATLDWQLSKVPYISGYSPIRWRQGIQVMLQKKPGNFRVDKLRAILLFEPDFNSNNKRLGRDMMYYAEDLQLIAQEQFGSRKAKSAIDHCLNKRLAFDIVRQKRISFAMLSNDAKACYDRIVHSVASLCMQRVGVPKEPIICMFGTLQKLRHYVRTIYGDSDISFSGDLWTVPIQGVGQGNGAGPQIWAVISTPILNLLRKEGYTTVFKAAMSGDDISFVGYAFVDDTDLCITTDEVHSQEQLGQLMQDAANLWEGGLSATGGAIEPAKSHWYLIHFKSVNGRWRYCSIQETPATISVRNPAGALEQLERLEVHDARRTLGVRLAPDGNNTQEAKYLEEVANVWADKIRTGHLPRHLVWEAMNSTILKKLQYPLPATTLNTEDCQRIMSKLLTIALPRAGIARSMPRAVVYGTRSHLGLHVPNLFAWQGAVHIERLLKYGSFPDQSMTGKLLWISAQQLKIEVGMDGSLFSLPPTIVEQLIPVVTPSWMSHTWSFITGHGFQVKDRLPDFRAARSGDQFLMRLFLSQSLSQEELYQCNICRMHIQAVTISDLVSADGNILLASAWMCQLDEFRISPFQWPTRMEIPNHFRATWQRILPKIIPLVGRSFRLQQPLGSWCIEPPLRTWLEPESERLYLKAGSAWKFYRRRNARASRQAVMRFDSTENMTADAPQLALLLPVTVVRTRGGWNLVGIGTGVNPTSMASPQTLADWVAQLPETQRWAVQHFKCDDEGQEVATALKEGTLRMISDGSFKEGFGTAHWILEPASGQGRIEASLICPGVSEDQSAYRSELMGIYGGATMVQLICSKFNITTGTVEFACDGRSALDQAANCHQHPDLNRAQFDVIAGVRTILRSSPVTWKKHYVLGHQDAIKGKALDYWEERNVECDQAAKQFWLLHHRTAPASDIFGEPWQLWFNGKKITNKCMESIISAVVDRQCDNHWTKKGKFGNGNADNVDWLSIGKAMEAIKPARRHWVAKFTSGHCAVGKMMHKRKEWDSANCPRCNEAIEDVEHVWRCKHSGAIEVWQEALKRLEEFLIAQDTAQELVDGIIKGLQSWQAGTDLEGYTHLASRIQSTLGWSAFLEGRVAVEWREAQNAYLRQLDSKKSSLRWATSLILKLWETAWDMWEHRNGMLHDREQGLKVRQLRDQIRAEFTLGTTGLPPDARRLFRLGEQAWLTTSQGQQEAWLIRVKAARVRAENQSDHGRYQQERRSLASWLNQGRIG